MVDGRWSMVGWCYALARGTDNNFPNNTQHFRLHKIFLLTSNKTSLKLIPLTMDHRPWTIDYLLTIFFKDLNKVLSDHLSIATFDVVPLNEMN